MQLPKEPAFYLNVN